MLKNKFIILISFFLSDSLQCADINRGLFSHDIETVRKAIADGANINIQARYGWTALMHAADLNDIEKVKLLIKAKADLNIQCNRYWTALMHAAFYGKTEIVKLLINAGADINIKDRGGYAVTSRFAYLEEVEKIVNNYLSNSETQMLPRAVTSIVNEYLGTKE